MRWWLLAIAGCGRVDFAPLAGDAPLAPEAIDAPPCTFGDFGAPQTVAGLNSGGIDWGPSLSHDGLTLVFASDRGGSGDRMFVATRATLADAWSVPVLLFEQPATQDDPSLAADGLSLYWGGSGGVLRANRATTTQPWTLAGPVLPSTATYTVVGGPDVSPDQLALTFTATAASDGAWHMYEAIRASPTASFGDGVDLFGASAAFGSLRGDRLEAIWQTGGMKLMHAVRPAVDAPFGAASPVLASAANDGDPDLSDDGTTLWFASDRAGSWDLWFATRSCE